MDLVEQIVVIKMDLVEQIVIDLTNEMSHWREPMRDIRTCHSIFLFPGCLSGIEKGIRLPKLASFGPYHNGETQLLPFEEHKKNFRCKFLEGKTDYFDNLVLKLASQESSIRGCYYEKTDSISSIDFVKMMIMDGSFIVELFLQYKRNPSTQWPWLGGLNTRDGGPPSTQDLSPSPLNTLTADLLKLENQLPLIVLEILFHWYCQPSDQATSNRATSDQAFRTLALRFFNHAFGRPLDVVYPNKHQPKHLLDLFRSSLLPTTPPRNNCKTFFGSIQSAAQLCNAGITLRRKKANSFLEIDFRKLQIPPFALKIPPVAIDDLTSTILVNCVALEQCLVQCFNDGSKYFTAYILFLTCLLTESEDVRFLRAANIITGIQPDNEYVFKLLDSVRGNFHYDARDSYLWKQYSEIDSYCDSFGKSIWCNLASYKVLSLVVSILAVIIALASWLFTWLLPKN